MFSLFMPKPKAVPEPQLRDQPMPQKVACRVVGMDTGRTRNSRLAFVRVVLEIEEGPDAGCRLHDYFVNASKLRHLGLPDSPPNFPTADGKRFMVEVKHVDNGAGMCYAVPSILHPL